MILGGPRRVFVGACRLRSAREVRVETGQPARPRRQAAVSIQQASNKLGFD